jgi:hypothetical protein
MQRNFEFAFKPLSFIELHRSFYVQADLRPDKSSKQLKVGEFTAARIVGTQGHDLVALPV